MVGRDLYMDTSPVDISINIINKEVDSGRARCPDLGGEVARNVVLDH